MSEKASPNRWLQAGAIVILGVFILGFIYSPLGAWTGAILGAWFVGTQRPWRGFLLLVVINLVLSLFSFWRAFRLDGIESAAWMLLAIVISVVPFLLYRLVIERRPGFLATLSLPVWGGVFVAGMQRFLPARLFTLFPPAHMPAGFPPMARIAATLGPGPVLFLIYWFGAVIVWMWIHEFKAKKTAAGAGVFGAVVLAVLVHGFLPRTFHPSGPQFPPAFGLGCLIGALILSLGALLQPSDHSKGWADRAETVALLRSPYTGNALQVAREDGGEVLVSSSGERFPVRHGIPIFVEPQKLSGSNQKYNHLYETIGGLYDDSQKVACALGGFHQYDEFSIYHCFLEVKPGDKVLETSVGTGLNFKYLPRGVKLFGLDLSAEMLANCQANLRRWDLEADLFLGNAEYLPFADDSFDVVYHVGGINFFNDRAKAIREMIRVAKPGTRILIADETEVHVKEAYERAPITRRYFKGRQEAVSAPVDLVPPEMKEIHLEFRRDGHFYALMFRKPAAEANSTSSAPAA